DAVDAAPAEAVAADADAIAQRLAIAEDQIEPPLGGIDDYRAGRIIGGIVDRLARDRACSAAAKEIRAAAHDVAHIEALGARRAAAGQQRHNQHSQSPDHLSPLFVKIGSAKI